MRASAIVLAIIFIWCPPVAFFLLVAEYLRSKKEQEEKIKHLEEEQEEAYLSDADREEIAQRKEEGNRGYNEWMRQSALAREHWAEKYPPYRWSKDEHGNTFYDVFGVNGFWRTTYNLRGIEKSRNVWIENVRSLPYPSRKS